MYMSYFDNPIFYEIKDIIDQGLLGEVSSVRARAGANSAGFVKPGNWRNSAEKTGGGALIQLALHPLNMVQWLVGRQVEQVMAFSHNLMSPLIGGDDVTVATCYLDGGILAAVEASYCSHEFTLSVYGTKGFITVSENTRVEIVLSDAYEGSFIRYGKPSQVEHLTFPRLSVSRVQLDDNPHDQHAAFVKAMQRGEPAPIPADIGLRDLRIVKAIYRSAREKAIVDLRENAR
jgi:predicted dehydrogenase